MGVVDWVMAAESSGARDCVSSPIGEVGVEACMNAGELSDRIYSLEVESSSVCEGVLIDLRTEK